MDNQSVYKEILLDHFHNPRNKGSLGDMQVVRRGSNPRCGDEIEVGVASTNNALEDIRFRGRGCSICLASASIMTECTHGLKLPQARNLIDKMQNWIAGSGDDEPPSEDLAAFGPFRQHPARKKCVLLAWQALVEILDELEGHNEIPDS